MRNTHGSARLNGNVLRITVDAKRGNKTVLHTTYYLVSDVRPDTRVANPAFKLEKVEEAHDASEEAWTKTGDIYHVAIDQHGYTCSCPHATFRGENVELVCKHIKAMIAVQKLPRLERKAP